MHTFQTTLDLEQRWAPSVQAIIARTRPTGTFVFGTARRASGVMTKADAIIQKRSGDYTALEPGTGYVLDYHEAKIETKTRPNFFVETWSNLANEHERMREGWFTTCQADVLWYGFADTATLYEMNWAAVKAWLSQSVKGDDYGMPGFWMERLSTYQERDQKASQQKNRTVGRLVPISHLQKAGLILNTHTMQRPAP